MNVIISAAIELKRLTPLPADDINWTPGVFLFIYTVRTLAYCFRNYLRLSPLITFLYFTINISLRLDSIYI